MEPGQRYGLHEGGPGSGHYLHRKPNATVCLPLHLRVKLSITHTLTHVRHLRKEKQWLRLNQSKTRKCHLRRRLLLRLNVLQRRAAVQMVGDFLFPWNSRKKNFPTRTSVAAYVFTAVCPPKVGRSYSAYASRKSGGSVIATIKIKFLFLRPLIFASSTTTTFFDGADWPCTIESGDFFTSSDYS